MKSPVAFISHSSQDKDRFVIKFATELRANGVDAWVDQWEMLPGDSLIDKIFNIGIANANAIIVIISAASIESKWVKEELDLAMVRRLETGAKVIVVRLDDAEVPTSLQGLLYEAIDPNIDWNSQFDRILRAIFQVPDRPPLGPPPSFVGSLQAKELDQGDVRPPATAQTVMELIADPRNRVQLHQTVKRTCDRLVQRLGDASYGQNAEQPNGERIQARLDQYDEDCADVASSISVGVYYGTAEHDGLWVGSLKQIIATANQPITGTYHAVWEDMRKYPALRLFYAAGIAAVDAGHWQTLRELSMVKVQSWRASNDVQTAVNYLGPGKVIENETMHTLPRAEGSRYYHPVSRHLHQVVKKDVSPVIDGDAFPLAFERFEVLRTLLEADATGNHYFSMGEFGWRAAKRQTSILDEVNSELDDLGEDWPLLKVGAFGGDMKRVADSLAAVRDVVGSSRYWL
ncbi:toll/interleukin-1 receptor domain-containing protein [Kineosporia mesophila]|nr:toll/interleukin-1 receptor domain-containing protein [Kineosporia mesophila]MCD5353417.1 toll/interleukin-1 receptor domain-containing protein [Kineosporia mesophila]